MWLRAILLAALVSTGCGGDRRPGPKTSHVEGDQPALDPYAPRPPHVIPGEGIGYRLSLHGLEVASFTIIVGELGSLGDRPAVVVQSALEASPLVALVRDLSAQYTSWIDAETSRTIRFISEEPAGPSDTTTEQTDAVPGETVDGSFPVVVRRPDTGELVERQVVGTAPVYDLNGYLMFLRSWTGEIGATGTADILRSRYLWRTETTMIGPESVVTELGKFSAVRIDGQSRRVNRTGEIDPTSDVRTYSVWISDDADRVPLLMVAHADYGDVRMEIVAYQPGY